jgi:hypothetical protein
LRQVTKCYHDRCSKYFGDGGIDMEMLYEKFDEYIVEDYTNNNENKIAKELDSSVKNRIGKHNMTHK